jgi:pimeloyl-ACP methyl ester carboxylesterase
VRRKAQRSLADQDFTPFHRGGSGPPLVCLHGFVDTWRTWELVLPAFERRHDVLALTMAGHAGGPPIEGEVTDTTLVEAVERVMDDAGVETAHIVGNSLGGFVSLQLASRGRARTVTALAPAGGWAAGDESFKDLLRFQDNLIHQLQAIAASAVLILSSPEGRRLATQYVVENYEHIPTELIAHQMLGAARCTGAKALIAYGLANEWKLDAEQITCPVRIVWGREDKLLPWPEAAARFQNDWLPQADWIDLEGVGHCPQLDVPAEAADLILSFADR